MRFNPSCGCCCNCRNSSILLLVDTTGSMRGTIARLKVLFHDLEEDFDHASCEWGIAEYKDYEDGINDSAFYDGWKVLQTFTTDFSLVITAVDSYSASGGGDTPEQNFDALLNSGNLWESELLGSTDPEKKRVIIWAGDEPSWNGTISYKPHVYPERSAVISSLSSANIKVFGLNTSGAGGGIDGQAAGDNEPFQASSICNATGGEVFHNIQDIDDVHDALCKALRG